MSFRRTATEISENLGSGTADFADKVGEGVRGFACDIWYNFPDYVTNGGFITNSFARGFMQNLCRDKNLPPPPNTPFDGGQCTGVRYGVSYQTAVISNGTLSGWSATVQTSAVVIIGAIQSAKLYVDNIQDEDLEHWSFDGQGEPPSLNTRNKVYRLDVVDSQGLKQVSLGTRFGTRVVGFYRYDGQPDTCGDLPVTYPPTSPPLVPGTDISITVDDDTTINLPVTVILDDRGSFSFPLSFVVGNYESSVTYVTIDLGGFEFSSEPPSPPSAEPPSAPPPVSPPGGGGGGGGGTTNEEPPPPESDPEIEVSEPVEEELQEDEVAGLAYIDVIITGKPSNAKRQEGSPGDDIYFPGFVAFRSKGVNLLPRYPLHYLNNRIKALPGADGYGVRLYEGYTGKVIKYTTQI